MEYRTLAGFDGIYLEDSWILGIQASPGELTFRCDLVLAESHPAYRPPRPGEQYCYSKGSIRFTGVRILRWVHQKRLAAVDASGECDYGSFDEFIYSDDTYELAGDFGHILVEETLPQSTWMTDPSGIPEQGVRVCSRGQC